MKKALLLINVGTPDNLDLVSVKKYLQEFLTDPLVIPLPNWARNLLVNGFIVPFRSPKSLKKYEKIWLTEGSPLRVYGERLKEKVATNLGEDFLVFSCMRYGNPSIDTAMECIAKANISEVYVLPLYPQWSMATTETVVRKVQELNEVYKFKLKVKAPFFSDAAFLKAQQNLIENSVAKFNPDSVLFSFHGLPDKPEARRYFEECHATAKLLANYVGQVQWQTSFQSRLGPTKWLAPSTEASIEKLATEGKKRLLVVSPAFVADGLETLEELAIEGAHQFKTQSQGGDFYLVPSLNDSDLWAEAIVSWIKGEKFL